MVINPLSNPEHGGPDRCADTYRAHASAGVKVSVRLPQSVSGIRVRIVVSLTVNTDWAGALVGKCRLWANAAWSALRAGLVI